MRYDDFPAVTPLSEDEFDITTVTETTLPVSHFKISEDVPSFQLKSQYEDLTGAYAPLVRVDSRYPHFHFYENTAPGSDDLPRTLVFQGSYYNRGPQFLVSRMSDYIGVHNYANVMNLDYYFNMFQPQAVVFEVAEYTVSDTYFSSQSMRSIDWNPPLFVTDSETAYEEQLDRLKETAVLFPIKDAVRQVRGEYIDTVFVDRTFSDMRYAYLATDSKWYDIKKQSGGMFAGYFPAGTFARGDPITLFMEDYDGNRYYSTLRMRTLHNEASPLVPSEHATIEDDSYTFTTDVEGNRFSRVNFQLIDAVTGTYLETINTTDGPGTVRGIYTVRYPDGDYFLRLRGNTNLKDEYVDCRLRLHNGEKIVYTFTVDALSTEEVHCREVRVWK